MASPGAPLVDEARLAPISLVAVGASAGGVETLQRLVSELDGQLRVAVAIVLHLPAGAHSVLPDILRRCSSVPCAHAVDLEPVVAGRIYVAPPDGHLVVEGNHFRLTRGARENDHRPAIDPLLRSMARDLGHRGAGVVLSGTLDDGAAGLAALRRSGGLAVVQDPDDALFSSMPMAALEAAGADLVAGVTEIGRFIRRLPGPLGFRPPAATPLRAPDRRGPLPEDRGTPGENAVVGIDPGEVEGPPSRFTCPDCHGSLWQLDEGGELRRYRCRVGHSWTEDNLADRQSIELENALWTALRVLHERSDLFRRMRADALRRGHPHAATLASDRLARIEQDEDVLRRVLAESAESAESAGGEGMVAP